MKAQPISPSDILPFCGAIEELRQKGWGFDLCVMYDNSMWHVVFNHMGNCGRVYAHGYGFALRNAMKQAIKNACAARYRDVDGKVTVYWRPNEYDYSNQPNE